MFQRQIIFEGTVGVSTVTSASCTVSPVVFAPSNMSPEWTEIVPPESVPNPTRPFRSYRIHCAMTSSLARLRFSRTVPDRADFGKIEAATLRRRIA